MNTTKLLIYNTGSEGQGVVKMDNLELQRRLCWFESNPSLQFFPAERPLGKNGSELF